MRVLRIRHTVVTSLDQIAYAFRYCCVSHQIQNFTSCCAGSPEMPFA